MQSPVVIRWKRESFQQPAVNEFPRHQLVVEWDISATNHNSDIDISLSCAWEGEHIQWRIQRTMEEICELCPQSNVTTKLSSIEQAEACLLQQQHNIDAMLQFFELSQWTFSQKTLYKQEAGMKLKEGALEKANGGYESYNRSRWNVLIVQFGCILVSVGIYLATGDWTVLYVCFAIVSLLSLAHWTYYRLDAIDATCVIPCMLLPPVGPMIVLVWTLLMFVCQRGKKTRWFVLRPGHLEFYSDWGALHGGTNESVLTDVLLLDASTRVKSSRWFSRQFVLSTPYRTLRLWANTSRERNDWVNKISHCLEMESWSGNDDLMIASSFSPMRERVPAKFLVDGKDTFASMKQALLGAKREIFIAGWMLSPELYLDHGNAKPSAWISLVEHDSGGGVFQTKTSTMVYANKRYFYDLVAPCSLACYEMISVHRDAAKCSWVIEGLTAAGQQWMVLDEQRNIEWTLRDEGEPVRFFPQQSKQECTKFAITFLAATRAEEEEEDMEAAWTRVEQEMWECGGVRLFAQKPENDDEEVVITWFQAAWEYFFPAPFKDNDVAVQEVSSESRLDRIIAQKVKEGVKCYIIMYRDMDMFLSNASFYAKRKLLRHTVNVGALKRGAAGGDLQIIRHAPPSRASGSVQHLFSCSLSKGNTWWSHHEKLVCVDQSVAFIGGLDLAYGRYDDCKHELWDCSSTVWRGKDYYNAREKDFENLGLDPYSDSVDRSRVPRMPWHDVHCVVGGAAAVDIARHFVGRWNAERKETATRASVLLPRYAINTTSKNSNSALKQTTLTRCQVLRSVGLWSSPSKVESSILDGYLQLISTARRFIYIEQQFFSSSLGGKLIKNEIAQAIANRIVKACENNEPFRVIILLPVLPAFEGDVRHNSSSRSVLNWNLRTIRGMLQYLAARLGVIPPSSVLGFYSLRKAQANNNAELCSEPIYIHSKLLIVDDESAIIGSANLNDRSMLGTRDSELAVLIRNSPEFVQGLRQQLWAEHCGLSAHAEAMDCYDETWDSIANANTMLLERAFSEMPRDSHVSFAKAKRFAARQQQQEDVALARAEILRSGALRGHLIRFPIGYLSREYKLLPQIIRLEREGAIPFENFT